MKCEWWMGGHFSQSGEIQLSTKNLADWCYYVLQFNFNSYPPLYQLPKSYIYIYIYALLFTIASLARTHPLLINVNNYINEWVTVPLLLLLLLLYSFSVVFTLLYGNRGHKLKSQLWHGLVGETGETEMGKKERKKENQKL